jgi:hypothetical protein
VRCESAPTDDDDTLLRRIILSGRESGVGQNLKTSE